METNRAEELVKKIQELEAKYTHLKQEMSKLISIDSPKSKSEQSDHPHFVVSPQRSRLTSPMAETSGRFEVSSAWKKGFASFSYSSQLERENNKNQDDPLSPKSPLPKFTDKQYLSILQSMGESLHIIDIHGRIIYWNPMAETLYGYSAPEALGQNATELIVDAHDFELASSIIQKITMGNSWKGHLPVKNKVGDRFLAISTNTPLYDEDGSLVGIICVSSDSKIFQEMLPSSSCGSDPLHKLSFVSQQPLQAAIASTISNLATKVSQVTNIVRLNLRTGENSTEREGGNGGSNCSDIGLSDSIHSGHREDANSSQASPLREEVSSDRFDVLLKGLIGEKPAGRSMTCSTDEGEEKTGFHKTITSKAEAWIAKKGISWPWKVHEHNELDKKIAPFIFPWSNHDQENDTRQHLSTDIGAKPEHQAGEGYHQTGTNEPLGSWSSCNFNSTSSAGSSGSTNSTAIHKLDVYSDYLDCEILWEDLLIREQIGQGSCGTVYHALWNGTDVAVKVFSKHEYSEDVILSFRQEVSLMKRLRHPNIVLFMGVVTSPQRLCIVTEFLPRGSLFRIIQRSASKLDWRRRIHMALDIARGMNYLHHCNPPIIHHDLKSSNLLVDMNWNVKVSDFGLSRLKGESYITKKTDKGTPQWMAPEILCDEPSDEKSDVYSFGVILWELVTEKIPWENLNSVQVIGAVGFMHHQLDIPNNLDPQWVSIIESCWNSDPQQRPTFQEVLDRLKDMQRRYLIQFQATRLANGERARKMSET